MSSTRGKNKADRVARILIGIVFVAVLIAVIVFGVFLFKMFANTFGKASGEAVDVPNVIGMSQQQAEDALRQRGLGSQVVQNANTDEQEAGNVFRQDPPANKPVRPGRSVKLMVSLGPPTYTVPNLIGAQLDDAPSVLERARLRLGAVERVFIRGAKRGKIINQNPIAGTPLANPAPIDLTVADSGNPPTAVIPLLIGLNLASAESELVKANLQLAKVTYIADDASAPGTVTKQKPDGNTDGKLGDKVEIEVAISTAEKTAPQKTLTIHLRVPPGADKQRVQIKVTDSLGAQTIEDSVQAPGSIIDREIPVEGEAKLQIFIGDAKTPFREDVI